MDGSAVYEDWDRRGKRSHRIERAWLPFAEHAERAMAGIASALGLAGDPAAAALLDSIGDWPLWPDVEAGVTVLGTVARVGVLPNVVDAIYARTRVPALGVLQQTC